MKKGKTARAAVAEMLAVIESDLSDAETVGEIEWILRGAPAAAPATHEQGPEPRGADTASGRAGRFAEVELAQALNPRWGPHPMSLAEKESKPGVEALLAALGARSKKRGRWRRLAEIISLGRGGRARESEPAERISRAGPGGERLDKAKRVWENEGSEGELF
jgi:hypothetical protein